MPTQQRRGLDQYQRIAPTGEQRRETGPHEPISRAQLRRFTRRLATRICWRRKGVLGEKLFARARQIEHQASDHAPLPSWRYRTEHQRDCDTHQPPEPQTEPAEHGAMEP
jgi:hypothetical protein